MENTIPLRIYDFLKAHPPFQFFEKEQLLELAEQVVIQYRPQGEVLFRQGETVGNYIYFIQQGAINLYLESGGNRELADQCDEGELFGLSPLLEAPNYELSAEAAEESLIYAIPADIFQRVAGNAPKVWPYLAAHLAVSLQHIRLTALQGKIFLPQERVQNEAFSLLEIQPMEINREPVTCKPDSTIRDAACLMTLKEVGSVIVVDDAQFPIGIVTDKDLRRKVASGITPLESPVSAIMSSPVCTAKPTVTVADVQMQMVKHQMHHLCLTKDGTPNSPVVGIISEHDLLVVQGNNPAVFLREINRAGRSEELSKFRSRAENLMEQYILQEVSTAYISGIMTEVNDALIRRAIELAMESLCAEGHQVPSSGFCWLALGSAGREEQLLRTDQDSALVFEDPAANELEHTRTFYLSLARRVTQMLASCGFEPCPAEMMASNPRWCLSLEEWKSQFSDWMKEPDPKAIMYCSIFFDYRPVFGLTAMASALSGHIFGILEEEKTLLSLLAGNALEIPPPITFFRGILVERSGIHKEEFDIKGRAMMPLADAARVLALQHRMAGINSTFKRFEALARQEPQNRELYEQAAEAYQLLMRFRTLQGLKHRDSGRFFRPATLSKMQRMLLRNSFQPIRDLQSLLRTRFQLGFF